MLALRRMRWIASNRIPSLVKYKIKLETGTGTAGAR